MARKDPVELAGKRCGRMLVICRLESHNWKCLCDCGREFVARTRPIKVGRTVCCKNCVDWSAIQKRAARKRSEAKEVTPEEVRQRTLEVREGWSDDEKRKRMAVKPNEWRPPSVAVCISKEQESVDGF